MLFITSSSCLLLLSITVFIIINATALTFCSAQQQSTTTTLQPLFGYEFKNSSSSKSLRITSRFSPSNDSSSSRIMSAFDYSAILIYKSSSSSSSFDVFDFQSRVINSLPSVVKSNPEMLKMYQDNFVLLEYCSWQTEYRTPCQSMTAHDWNTFTSRVSLESAVSVCLDTIERSKTGNFGILPFKNSTSSNSNNNNNDNANGQQTLVRFSFNGANTKEVFSQLDAQKLGACQISSPEANYGYGFGGLHAFAGNILASHLDYPVVPGSVALPSHIRMEYDKLTARLKRDPVNSTAVGVFFFLLLLAGVIAFVHRLWQNKKRREAYRQQQKIHGLPEERVKNMSQKVTIGGDSDIADPYLKEGEEASAKNNDINEDDDDDNNQQSRTTNNNSGPVAVVVAADDDEDEMEMAIRNVREKFKKASDSVNTFLGRARDGDQKLNPHDDDGDQEMMKRNEDEDDDEEQDPVELERIAFEKKRQAALAIAAQQSDDSDDDDNDEENTYYSDAHSPASPAKRQDTDTFP